MQHHEQKDFVAATNKQYSIREFVELCCLELGINRVAGLGNRWDRNRKRVFS